jgi:hypothetical protein
MILVDYRQGSAELKEPLCKMGLPVEMQQTTLDFGDFAFVGRGAKGKEVTIGIEFKKVRELVAALRSQRLQGHQMVGMRNTYDTGYDHSYLLIEGEVLYDSKGRLQRREGRKRFSRLDTRVLLEGSMTVGELFKRVNVLHLCGGLNPWWCQTRSDSLQAIASLYHTWTDTDLDKHKSHLAIYTAPPLVPVSGFRMIASTLPGVGRHVSLALEQRFDSDFTEVCKASVGQLAGVVITDERGKMRRLGHKLAGQIHDFLRGPNT